MIKIIIPIWNYEKAAVVIRRCDYLKQIKSFIVVYNFNIFVSFKNFVKHKQDFGDDQVIYARDHNVTMKNFVPMSY